MTEEELRWWLLLSSVSGVGPARFRTLVSHCGSPKAAMESSIDTLTSLPRMDEKTALSIGKGGDERWVEEQLRAIRNHGVRLVTFIDEEYPTRLEAIYDPPPFLFVRGALSPDDELSVAVVGSREATPYGRLIAQRLSRELAERGVTVVSGMARGIDAMGHRGALEVGGRTLAILGCGVDVTYPPENRGLKDRILERGAVLSEFPMGTKPEAPNFPRRNRIISGISLGVIVVEAGQRSGALITAAYALEQGREVFAIPGNIDAQKSQGTNRLIQHGAKLVQSVDDVLEELRGMARFKEPEVADLPQDLHEEEREVYQHLSLQPTHVDQISQRTGFDASRVLSILLSLELRGVIRQLSGKLFVRA